jgi:hypothetical protein
MNRSELADFLIKFHSKNDILYLTELVNKDKIDIVNVLELCEKGDAKLVFRAAWLLENVVFNFPELFKKNLRQFLDSYQFQENESAQRHFSKIAMRISEKKWMVYYQLTYSDLENCLNTSFEWLINPKTQVAVKCNCIDIIYHLLEYEDWMLEELKLILEKNLLSNSPALLSRTKKILKKIKKGNR